MLRFIETTEDKRQLIQDISKNKVLLNDIQKFKGTTVEDFISAMEHESTIYLISVKALTDEQLLFVIRETLTYLQPD
ncbi:hypothetical protein [Niabella sp.]|uniref:hypothetical protein n=1 Tax=Niabella sp. TaxID=1962976 RepID=UPI00260FCDB2|nr:hypothetical protein [Niabella sp.]